MKKLTLPESVNFPPKSQPSQFAAECWFDDACILDMDYFVKTLAAIKAKGVRPDLIGSIIAHYASKWLPDLSTNQPNQTNPTPKHPNEGNALLSTISSSSPESVTASWMKKRFFVETLTGILPPDKDSIPCNFLLRLLRVGNMVGVEPTYKAELEKRISSQLDQATLMELMIPSFSHTCGTLLDVDLFTRLVKRFVEEWDDDASNVKNDKSSSVGLVKVGKLVDSYLAEAAVDRHMSVMEFVELGGAFPGHARCNDDGLYRAIDTYLKAHPNVSKHERKSLFRLIDSRKLSSEASLHAAQNERLPVRALLQVLFAEQNKVNVYSRHHHHHNDWSGSFSGTTRSPNIEQPTRCLSKRELVAKQKEIYKLREDVVRLQSQCSVMQCQIEKLVLKKKSFFRWKKFGFTPSSKSVSVVDKIEEMGEGYHGEFVFGSRTPKNVSMKFLRGKTPPIRRKSMS